MFKTAKLFQNGHSQALRLPKEFRFAGKQVFIKKMGEMVLLIPQHYTWQSWFEGLDMFSSDFMSQRTQPTQSREPFFE